MNRVPEDFRTITPQIVVQGVAEAIAWYTRAFGAHELLRNTAPDGKKIMHSELLLGDSRFFVVDEFPGSMVSPTALGGTTVTLHLYVDDVDALFDRAVNAGAKGHDAGRRSILGRPVRHDHRSLRTPVVHGQPHRGSLSQLAPGACRLLGQQREKLMTYARMAFTTAVAFVVSQILAIAVHGFILASDYAPFYGTLLRSSQAGPSWQMLFLPVAHLCFISTLVWVYARLRLEGSRTVQGLKLGFVGWIMGQAPLWLLWYAEQPWPGVLVVKQLGYELVSSLFIGLAIAAVARQSESPAGEMSSVSALRQRQAESLRRAAD
jgi:uncharacterized glyoxalase superfamily protein PhnB